MTRRILFAITASALGLFLMHHCGSGAPVSAEKQGECDFAAYQVSGKVELWRFVCPKATYRCFHYGNYHAPIECHLEHPS